MKNLLIFFSLMFVSLSSVAATIPLEWNAVAGPITGPVAQGGNISTVEALLFDSNTNTEIGIGSISDFILSAGSAIMGTFTGAAGSYSIMGTITSIDFFGGTAQFTFSGFSADNNINLGGSISVAPGSSSLNLAGTTIDFTPVPIPAAIWLFGSAFIGLFGFRRSMC